jgi:hypothetical protein
MRALGSMYVDERARLELASCPSCGSTLCVAVRRLFPSGYSRATRLEVTRRTQVERPRAALAAQSGEPRRP